MMNYYPEALLSRSQSCNLSWPLPEQALVYNSRYVIDKPNANHTTRTSEDDAPSRRRPIRVYHASPYDISAFLQTLERIRHRSVNINDMLIQQVVNPFYSLIRVTLGIHIEFHRILCRHIHKKFYTSSIATIFPWAISGFHL